MTELFLKIINMSISASWVVLAVLVLRLVLKKAPKWVNVLLWGVVVIRLLCPFSIESALSLIPNAETISPELMIEAAPSTHSDIPTINSIINQTAASQQAPLDTVSANPLQFWIPLLAGIWAAGIAALLLYSAISYRSLYNRVRTAVRLRGSIYQSENVSSPFILGIIKPKIYLPFCADGQNMEYAVAHEQAHIRRRDHWWKPLGFLLLAIHWFNPIMWLAYILLCRDIELACDEKVIKDLGNDQRADYSDALLSCSINKRMITVCPLAFGETGIKERVKSVINYKKPAVWLIAVSIIACIVLGVCFLTDPEEAKPKAWPEFEDIRTGYTKEQAEEDGCVVIEGCTLLAGEKSWLEFVSKTKAGNSAIVRVYQAYTTDSDLKYTIKELSYNGEKFLLQFYDRTGDTGEEFLSSSEYSYLIRSPYSPIEKSFDTYLLANDPEASTEEYFNSTFSSNCLSFLTSSIDDFEEKYGPFFSFDTPAEEKGDTSDGELSSGIVYAGNTSTRNCHLIYMVAVPDDH
ncbi:MAG: M56 family metallopeptidase [Christensenellales bacterium]